MFGVQKLYRLTIRYYISFESPLLTQNFREEMITSGNRLPSILASAAMAMTSCSSSKNAQNENATKAEKITEAEAARPSADEEMECKEAK